jgi:hypothetical protein
MNRNNVGEWEIACTEELHSAGIGRSDELALQWGKALDLSAFSTITFALLGLVQVSLWQNTL